MVDIDPRLYGARWAENYDEWHAGLMDDEGAVATLAELAGGGPVLELGSARGGWRCRSRRRGSTVVGVDISDEMLAQLAKKSTAVTAVVGDMTTVRLEREFAVAYIAFNSIFVLPTQEDRSSCSATRRRTWARRPVRAGDDGRRRRRPGDAGTLRVSKIENGPHDAGRPACIDPVTQFHSGMWVILEPDGTRSSTRSTAAACTHDEMDLMAQLAGLELENRWGDWTETPFTGKSTMHISGLPQALTANPSHTGKTARACRTQETQAPPCPGGNPHMPVYR